MKGHHRKGASHRKRKCSLSCQEAGHQPFHPLPEDEEIWSLAASYGPRSEGSLPSLQPPVFLGYYLQQSRIPGYNLPAGSFPDPRNCSSDLVCDADSSRSAQAGSGPSKRRPHPSLLQRWERPLFHSNPHGFNEIIRNFKLVRLDRAAEQQFFEATINHIQFGIIAFSEEGES